MSQQLESVDQKSWVLISVFKNDITEQDVQRITPQVENLVENWHSQGKIMLSGAFDDNKTGMALFNATESEAKQFLDKYGKACEGVLDYFMYQWDAMPILSIMEKQN